MYIKQITFHAEKLLLKLQKICFSCPHQDLVLQNFTKFVFLKNVSIKKSLCFVNINTTIIFLHDISP